MVAKRNPIDKTTAGPERPALPCERCVDPARVRVRTAAGWQNLCHKCNDRLIQAEAEDYCKAHGLDTLEKQKAYCRSRLKAGLIQSPPPREPGDDDEQAPA